MAAPKPTLGARSPHWSHVRAVHLHNQPKCREAKITFQGKTQSMRAWSIETGINLSTIHQRFNKNWPAEMILKPTAKMKRKQGR